VDTLATRTYGMSNFAQLRFANHDARIYGADLSGSGVLWNSVRFGSGQLSGVAGWLHGERLDTQTGLYQMMPLNIRVAFDEELMDGPLASAFRPWIANPMWTCIALNKTRRVRTLQSSRRLSARAPADERGSRQSAEQGI